MAAEVRRIVVIQGHPDRSGGHYCHALAEQYVRGARDNGHDTELIEIAALDVPFLRSREELAKGAPPPGIRHAQSALLACDHVVMIYPLWNGAAPALVRAFMEQTLRPSFIFPDAAPDARLSFAAAFTQRKALKGKSARVIATMQMPAWIYRWVFRPHQEANALWLAGARPVRQTAIGFVEAVDRAGRDKWLRRVFALGQCAR